MILDRFLPPKWRLRIFVVESIMLAFALYNFANAFDKATNPEIITSQKVTTKEEALQYLQNYTASEIVTTHNSIAGETVEIDTGKLASVLNNAAIATKDDRH